MNGTGPGARVRLGSALFNADHARLGDELRRVEAAGVDFLHLDVFDGYAVKRMVAPSKRSKIPQNSAYERATTLSRR